MPTRGRTVNVTRDLIPHLGRLKLDELTRRYIADFARTQLAYSGGPFPIYRCPAILFSAFDDAVPPASTLPRLEPNRRAAAGRRRRRLAAEIRLPRAPPLS